MKLYLSYDPAQEAQAELLHEALSQFDPTLQWVQRPAPHSQQHPPNEPDKLAIRQALSQGTVVLCLLSQEAAANQWVGYELVEAEQAGRGILGLAASGAELSPNQWPEFFRLRHNQYEVLLQWDLGKKLHKALVRAEKRGTQTNLFGF